MKSIAREKPASDDLARPRMKRYARIAATGRYVPEKVITNQSLNLLFGEDVDSWLQERVGIKERHLAAENEATSDLAVAAARQALERSGVAPENVDLIILCTDTPDYISPATASVVQHKLEAKRAATFDVNCACAAFVTGLDIAAKYIAADPAYENILVIGAYCMSKFLNWRDKTTCTIFADGAGAVLIQPDEEPGFLASKLVADGSYHDYMGIYVGGTYCVPRAESIEKGEHYLAIRKRFPPDTNSSRWPQLVREVAAKAGHTAAEIDFVLFTQININTIRQVMEELGLPLSKTHWVMDKWGYTGSACIPMALDDAVGLGKIRKGDLVVMCGSGGGLAMGAVAFRWI